MLRRNRVIHLIVFPLDHVELLLNTFQLNFTWRGHVEYLCQSDDIAAQPELLLRVLVTQAVAIEENGICRRPWAHPPHLFLRVEMLRQLLLVPQFGFICLKQHVIMFPDELDAIFKAVTERVLLEVGHPFDDKAPQLLKILLLT